MRSSLYAGGRPRLEVRLVLEAAFSLLAAKAALRVLPFRWLEHLFALPVPGPELLGIERGEARDDVRRAVECAARRLPVRTACFPRAMAVQSMLRRRGVGAALVYGASGGPGKGLVAHVWVEDEGVAVIGGNESEGLAVLARFVPGSGLPLSSRRHTL